MFNTRMRLYGAVAALLIAFLSVYLPDVGHGLIKDDFMWILTGRVDSAIQLLDLFRRNVGFYRPIVSATFAADYALWGTDAFGYGLTNLAVMILNAGLLLVLGRHLGLAGSAAVLAVGVWMFNFHGVNMALLWLSGRTALLLCFFALLAALAVLKHQIEVGALLCLAAMLCKEEAVLLPVLFAAFLWIDSGTQPPRKKIGAMARMVWPLFAALLCYAVLRARSGAFGPSDAPSYYQFTFSPIAVGRNVLEYLDRGATVPALVALTAWLVGRPLGTFSSSERRTITFGGIWFVCGYAITILLPVRSSLYALFPSIGSALIAASVAAALLRVSASRFNKLSLALIVVVVALIPVYRSRNLRWVALADLSSRVMGSVTAAVERAPEPGRIVLIDDPSARFNLDSAFGTLFQDAVTLVIDRGWRGEIISRPEAVANSTTAEPTLMFELRHGNLVAIRHEIAWRGSVR